VAAHRVAGAHPAAAGSLPCQLEARLLTWLAAAAGVGANLTYYLKTKGPAATIILTILQVLLWSFFVGRTRSDFPPGKTLLVVDGFGNHDPGTGRRNMKRPRWDILHPGRSWAGRLQPAETAKQVIAKLKPQPSKSASIQQRFRKVLSSF
jgi:hypothetical protein